jgi:SAM-dependent methyltransferase
VDLDRDMTDVIPTGTTRDSAFLFERMTDASLARAVAPRAGRVLDVASGFGQDALALAARGARVVGAEPSARMTAWARLRSAEAGGVVPLFVRAWSDALPFADAAFHAALCKGALDHFDRPERAIAEMARVTRSDGVVVLAVANFESLACRVARAADDVRGRLWAGPPARGRRHYDVPADHFTRYDLALVREQAARHLRIEAVLGISLAWGVPAWTRALEKLPARAAALALRAADLLARLLPSLADVVVVAGRPRRSQLR